MSEVYVFGFLDDVELEPDEFTLSFAKNKINCPRCKHFIERAEKLLTDRRLLTKQDIAGICDHCWKQLAKIQKLVRLTKRKENIAAVAESDALKRQIEQAKELYEQNVIEPKGFKERATTLGTLAPQTYISEGKADEEKLLVRDEFTRAAGIKIKARGENFIAGGLSEKEKDTEIIAREESLSEKGKIINEQGKKLIPRERSQSTTDTKSKAREEKKITQGESPSAKDERSKTRGEKPAVQEEAQSPTDQKSKTRVEKPMAQGEPQSTTDQKSKTRVEKPMAQGEPQSTRDQKSKARGEKSMAQEEPVITKDKKLSKVNAEKTKAQGELATDKDKKSIAREELPTANAKSQTRDGKLITKDNLLDSNAKNYKTKDAQEKLLTKKEKKSKARDEQSIVNDESLRAKDNKEKRKVSVKNEEEQKAKDNKSNVRDGKPITKEETLNTKGKLEGKENIQKEKPPQKSTSAEQLKALIAQEKLRMEKEKLEMSNRKKQQEEEKKLLEIAAKRAKEALEVAKKANANQPPKIILPISVSESDVMPGPECAVYKAPVVSDIIMGETIRKKKVRQGDTDEDTQYKEKMSKLPAVGSGKHGIGSVEVSKSVKKGRVPESDSPAKVPVVGSENPKKGAVVESENTEKVSAVKVKGNTEKATKKSKQNSEAANNKEDGRIRYALSDPTFIEKGWTKLPFEKVVRKMNVYRMRPSKPAFDWFEHHKNKVLEYDTGEILAEVDHSGRGRWYYRSGALAMDYYDAEETNAGQRFVVYSSGTPDARGRPRPRTVLATFDHAGSGIVFDHAGKTRLKYNQTEGIVLDREIGPVSRWKWHALNDPPVLQRVMLDTQLDHKDPDIARLGPAEDHRPQDDAMLSIELDNFVKEKTKKSSQKFKPFHIKMKALKINENFSLRVLDQASVYLLYRDGSTNLKVNIGMLLNHEEIVDTDAADIGDVANTMETLPARTASVAGLQRAAARARAAAAAERGRRARLHGRPEGQPSDIDSADALRAASSRAPRPPLASCGAAHCPTLAQCSCDLYCTPLF